MESLILSLNVVMPLLFSDFNRPGRAAFGLSDPADLKRDEPTGV